MNDSPTRRLTRPSRGAPASGTSAPLPRIWAQDKPGSLYMGVLITLLITIMIVPQGFSYASYDAMPSEGDALSRTIWLVLLFGSLYIVGRHGARASALIKTLNPFLLAWVALAIMSIAWSIEPTVTIRRVIRIVTILLVCIAFTLVGWHPRRFQNALRFLLTGLLVASIIFVYESPELAIHQAENHPELKNAWHGIATGKNILGSLSSAAFLLWLHALLAKEANIFKILAGAGLALTCLIGSRSSTSLMATAFGALFMLILLKGPGRRYMRYLVMIFAALILLYAIAALNLIPGMQVLLTPITMITGKDLTFTGRTNIWYVMNLHIRLHPWFGTGYGAYWVGPRGDSPSYLMLAYLNFYPNEGHNGYLDVINDLGLVGGFCLLAYFASYIKSALELMKVHRYQAGLYLTLLFRGFIADMSESHWFSVLSVDFVIMTLATTALARSVLQARLEAAAKRAQARSAGRAPPAASAGVPPRRPLRTGRAAFE